MQIFISSNQVHLSGRPGEMRETLADIRKVNVELNWKPKVDIIEWIGRQAVTYSKRFSSKFFTKLLQPAGNNPVRNRASSFEIIFEELDKKEDKNYLIVETGTMRNDHGNLAFGDDGSVHTSGMTSSTSMMVRSSLWISVRTMWTMQTP